MFQLSRSSSHLPHEDRIHIRNPLLHLHSRNHRWHVPPILVQSLCPGTSLSSSSSKAIYRLFHLTYQGSLSSSPWEMPCGQMRPLQAHLPTRIPTRHTRIHWHRFDVVFRIYLYLYLFSGILSMV